ncbi:MAG TPA: glucose-6-phosphate dehydrogenase [Streptosporangiaceae bacterium]|nr:glucose-6-phosphate dehydrogenase [Streptosporangiaceae bacterium]
MTQAARPRDRVVAESARQTLLILGAGGDLTARLLLPGLGSLLASDSSRQLDLLLLGSGPKRWDDQQWRRRVGDSFAAARVAGPRIQAVERDARFLTADATVKSDLRRLLDACVGPPVIFFALPPAVTMRACRALEGADLPAGSRLVMEKPFGTGQASARELNAMLARLVPEHQVYRVDHFLGKSTVLNILGLRFANRMLEPVLNAEHVEAIDIVWDESLALEGRAGYYDRAGALVDMIQSHLLQILALLAMRAPASLDPEEFRDRKAEILRVTRVRADYPSGWSRRARYTAGEVSGRRVPAYADEDGVDPGRRTETFAEVVFTVDTSRWAGVPFRARSGKALARPRKEAVITFKAPAPLAGLTGYARSDRLRIGFDPDRLCLDLNINGPGDPFAIDPVTLVAEFGPGNLSAYGEILAGVLADDPTLSIRGDTAEECWRIVEPVLTTWRNDEVPLREYPAGGTGPDR